MTNDSSKGKYASPEGSATWEYIAATSCALLIFCTGSISGWSSPTLARLMGSDLPNPLSASDVSTLSAAVAVGHALAPTMTMIMMDKLGRTKSLLAGGIPAIVSWGMITLSQDKTVLILARFIAGLSLGLMLAFVPMYLGEIASAKLRGGIGMVCGTMINAGILFMYVVVPYTSIQTMSNICLSIATVSVISVWFIPESPYYLATVGELEKAEIALEKLRDKTDVTEELELIKRTISEKGKSFDVGEVEEGKGIPGKSSPWKKLFTITENRRALFINFLFVGVLQLGGYITMLVYGQLICDKMKTVVPGHVCTMIIAVIQLVSNILTTFVIDRLGRKPLLFFSGVISGCCSLIIGTYFYFMEYTDADVTPYGLVGLGAVFVNTVAINIGLMPLQLVIQGEIISSEVKEQATCILGVGAGVVATFGVKSYLMVAETWGFGHSVPFFLFTAVTWSITALILKQLPETKGKTLLQIQKDLSR